MRARRIRAGLVVGLVVVAFVGSTVWLRDVEAQIDLSENRRFSLAPESRALAREVADDLDITVFLFEGGGAARDARFLLERYSEINDRIDYRIVDPDEQPGEAERYGITDYSTVVVEYQGRRTEVEFVSETQIDTALLRVLRGRTRVVCFVVGHGEAQLGDGTAGGLSDLAALLERNAYEPRELDLTRDPEVPSECDAVVLAGPTSPLGQREIEALDAYTGAAGRLMYLISPFIEFEADPNPLLNRWGIAYVGPVVVDPERSEGIDVTNLVVEDFPTANPIIEGVDRLALPASGGLFTNPDPRRGLTVSRLAVTSAAGFVEVDPDIEVRFSEGDLPGPVVVAAAADDSTVAASGEDRVPGGGPRILRTRVVATGNSVWATNRFLGELGNRRFLLNALGWLTEDEQVLTVGSGPAEPRDLPFTAERRRLVTAVAVVGAPGMVVALGLVQHVIRRRWTP